MPLSNLPLRGGYNFLGLPNENTPFEAAHAVVFPVPYDSTTSYRAGTRDGPSSILMASRNVELYDIELGCEPLNTGVITLSELEPDMRGPGETIDRLTRVMEALVEANKFPVMIGGEHSLTTAPVRALKKKYGTTLSVLQLDAHADLRDEYEHTPFNHAAVMRRVIDLVDITQVGIRNISAEEMDFVKEIDHQGIFWAHQIAGPDSSWMDRVVERLTEHVYISIDLDAFDPSIMPAVGTPEPGGLLWHTVLDLLLRVVQKRQVVGFDVMELCPIPGFVAPEFLAAKLIFKLLGLVFVKNGWVGNTP